MILLSLVESTVVGLVPLVDPVDGAVVPLVAPVDGAVVPLVAPVDAAVVPLVAPVVPAICCETWRLITLSVDCPSSSTALILTVKFPTWAESVTTIEFPLNVTPDGNPST